MALIRECQPKTFEEWEQYYFEKAYTKTKVPVKVTKEIWFIAIMRTLR
jgi:hypothetical protein